MTTHFFHYMESSPQLKGRARDFGASYRRMAVVETETAEKPKMISERAKGVVKIVDERTLSVGSTDRSYGYRERQRLQQLAHELQSGK